MRTLITTGALALAGLTGCALPTVSAHRPTAPAVAPLKPRCEAFAYDGLQLVTFNDGDPITCDVSPPQVLAIAYPGADGYDHDYVQADCDHAGGTVVMVGTTATCRGIDY